MQKILLNAGSGRDGCGANLPMCFRGEGWSEVRLDIDPASLPDIVGSMLDMKDVADASVDAVFSSHAIEHLYPSEIPAVCAEFLRVLKPEGFAVISCPDLQAAAQMIACDRLLDTAYVSPAGPVTPFDMVFSHRGFTRRDSPHMAHHSGFTLSVLLDTLRANGFQSVAGLRRAKWFDLWVLATKQPLSESAARELASVVLPPDV